jgi:hypothetical protein
VNQPTMATIMHRRADEPATGRSSHLLALGEQFLSETIVARAQAGAGSIWLPYHG